MRRSAILPACLVLLLSAGVCRANLLDDLIEGVVGDNVRAGLSARYGLADGARRPDDCRHFQRIAEAAGDQRGRLRLAFVGSGDVNAFAAPGGQVFVTDGLMAALQGQEQELAFCLGHEVSHITGGDTKKLARIALGESLLFGKSDADTQTLVALAQQMLTYKQSQQQEFAADAKAMNLLHSAGYDLSGGLALMRRLETLKAANPSLVDQLFATHPPTPERSERLKDQMLQLEYGRTFKEREGGDIELDVPFLAQGKGNNNCGPACLAMAARYASGGSPTQQDVKAVNEHTGKSDAAYKNTTDLERAARAVFQVAKASAGRWSYEEVEQEVSAGGPVIVAVTAGKLPRPPRRYESTGPHFVVVIGYAGSDLVCHDPGSRYNAGVRYPNHVFRAAVSRTARTPSRSLSNCPPPRHPPP